MNAVSYILQRVQIHVFLLSILIITYSYDVIDDTYVISRGPKFYIGQSGPTYARIFLTLGLALLFASLRKPAQAGTKICPSCETIYTNNFLFSCPNCNIALEPLKGYYERKNHTESNTSEDPSMYKRQQSIELHRKALDGLSLFQAFPVACLATPAWLPPVLTLPFALLLGHYWTMAVQAILVLVLCMAFFLQLEIRRGAMLSDPADMAPWRRRLVKVMLLMVAASALNVALDRIVLT